MNKHIRNGFGAVRPYLFGKLDLAEFVVKVFGAEELARFKVGEKGFHIESKIADSVVEGSQLLNDKQTAVMAADVAEAQQAEESGAADSVESIAAADQAPEFHGEAASEDISMEDVLGPGTRKKAASAEATDEPSEVGQQTY